MRYVKQVLLSALSAVFFVMPVLAQDAMFSDVTLGSGIVETTASFGIAWGDYDGDNLVDLYVTRKEELSALYHNNGDGTFTDVTASMDVVKLPGAAQGVAMADFDNDGDLDIYVSTRSKERNIFFRNEGGTGNFTEISVEAGVGSIKPSKGVSFGDYDGDSFLDIYVLNRGSGGGGVANHLYHSNGDGTFTDVGADLGVDGGINLGFGATWFDYDNDLDPDLYVANDFGGDFLYSNNGDGTFTDVTATATGGGPENSMGVCVGDYDNDLDLDVYVTNFTGDNFGQVIGPKGPSILWSNNNDGTFTDVTFAAGLLDPENVEWGCNFVDVDNDGDLDLFVVAGWQDEPTESQEDHLYRNDGNGTFTEIGGLVGLDNAGAGFGSAWADYDGDGAQDLYVSNSDLLPSALYHNDGPVGNWLNIKTVGTVGNRDGIGARATITVGTDQQIREVVAGSSFLSMSSLDLNFGVGTATTVDLVEVTWPSGLVDCLSNVPVNQAITVTEGSLPGPCVVAEPTTGSISGVVRDSLGNLLADADVRLIDGAGGRTMTTTDASGAFTYADVAAGIYKLGAHKSGVGSDFRAGVTLAAGEDKTVIDLVLSQ